MQQYFNNMCVCAFAMYTRRFVITDSIPATLKIPFWSLILGPNTEWQNKKLNIVIKSGNVNNRIHCLIAVDFSCGLTNFIIKEGTKETKSLQRQTLSLNEKKNCFRCSELFFISNVFQLKHKLFSSTKMSHWIWGNLLYVDNELSKINIYLIRSILKDNEKNIFFYYRNLHNKRKSY